MNLSGIFFDAGSGSWGVIPARSVVALLTSFGSLPDCAIQAGLGSIY